MRLAEVKLIRLLVEHKRIDILDITLKKIIEEYHIRTGVVLLNVYTSHETNQPQKIVIQNFIHNLIKQKTEISFFVDKSLI